MSLSHGNWKQIFDVFRFWELSFSGIFVKLSKEWDPPEWFVPSHNVSLQKSVWHSHSNLFFSLSLLLLHFFFSFTQSSLFSLTLHCSSTSRYHHTSRHHHEQPPRDQFKLSPDWAFVFFSLSLFPPFARLVSLSGIISLSHPFCHIVTIISNHHKPLWDQFKLSPDRAFVVSLSLSSLCRSVSLSGVFSLFHLFCQIDSSLCLILWFGSLI